MGTLMDPAASLEHTNVMQLNMHCCFMSKRVFFGAWQFIKKTKKQQILAGSSNLSICFCKIFSRCHVDQPGRRCFNNFTIV